MEHKLDVYFITGTHNFFPNKLKKNFFNRLRSDDECVLTATQLGGGECSI